MKLEEVNKYDLLVCDCHNTEHQMIFQYDSDDNLGYCSIHLKNDKFFKRLWNGIRYIFGHKSIYGDFDEFIFNESHADKLIEMGNKLKKKDN